MIHTTAAVLFKLCCSPHTDSCNNIFKLQGHIVTIISYEAQIVSDKHIHTTAVGL